MGSQLAIIQGLAVGHKGPEMQSPEKRQSFINSDEFKKLSSAIALMIEVTLSKPNEHTTILNKARETYNLITKFNLNKKTMDKVNGELKQPQVELDQLQDFTEKQVPAKLQEITKQVIDFIKNSEKHDPNDLANPREEFNQALREFQVGKQAETLMDTLLRIYNNYLPYLSESDRQDIQQKLNSVIKSAEAPRLGY